MHTDSRTRSYTRSLPASLRRLFLVAAIASTSLLATSSASAQGGNSDDVLLEPQYALPTFIGAEIGYAQWDNKANFSVSDRNLPCATFTDGSGKGPNGGAKAFLYMNPWFFVSPRLRYEARSGSFLTQLAAEPIRDADNKEVMLQQEAQVDATMAAAGLDLRVGIDVLETGFYVNAGAAGHFMMNGFYDYAERIKSPSNVVYVATRTTEQSLVGGRAFENYQRFALDLRGGIGYLLQLGRFVINPEVFYSFPVTSSLKAPEELKQTGYVGSLGFLFNFGE